MKVIHVRVHAVIWHYIYVVIELLLRRFEESSYPLIVS